MYLAFENGIKITLKTSLSLFFVLLGHFAFAQSIGGQSAYQFLNIPTSARASALGGFANAIDDGDVQLSMGNPSLLDSTQHLNLNLSYLNYFEGTNMGTVSMAYKPDSSKLTFMGGIQYLSFGAMDRIDASGVELGTFNAGDYLFQGGVALPMDSLWTIGANLKAIYSNLAQYSSFAVALDASALYSNPKRKFSASLMVRNLGQQLNSYTEVQDSLPLDIQLSIVKQLKHAPFRFLITLDQLQRWDLSYNDPNFQEVTDPITGETSGGVNFEFGDLLMRHVTIGTELLLSDNLHVRFGYNYRRRQEMKVGSKPGTAGFSWGAGMRIKRFHISYARSTYHLAGASNQFSITSNLSDWRR